MKENNTDSSDVLSLSRVIKETIALFCAYGLFAYAVLVINDMYESGKSVVFIPNFAAPLVCLSVIVLSAVRWVQFIKKHTYSVLQCGAAITAFTAVFALLCYNIFIPVLLIGSQALIAEVSAYKVVYNLKHGNRDNLESVYLKSVQKNNDYYNGLDFEDNIDILIDDFSDGISRNSYKSFRCYKYDGGGYGGGRGAITEWDYKGTFYEPILTNSGKQYNLSFSIVLFERDGFPERGLQYAVFTPIDG